MTNEKKQEAPTLTTLPGDDVRQVMWRFADRYEVQMLVQSARSVARGVVARLVAEGERNTHDWTAKKATMLEAFDASGLTSSFMAPEYGGYIEGPKNFAMSLVAFELAWVDAGAATASMANNLALAPIHERGTEEQKARYMRLATSPQPGEDRKTWRGAFILTEPLPYVGADTSLVSGRATVAEWPEDGEPTLLVEKRGRFITNMGYADFVTAAVETADPRLKSSCMVILEKTDPGAWDPGTPTKKMVHQLSSTNDPILSMRVPASRIIGGYTVVDGVIVPNFNHGDVIEAVFARTRITASVMTAAKLLSVVEPIIRYQRGRYRGAASVVAGSPRFELGLQQKDDAVERLAEIWAAGEAAASLALATSRLFDEFDPLEREKDEYCAVEGLKGRARLKAFQKKEPEALEYIALMAKPEAERDASRVAALESDLLVRFLAKEALANVYCPAAKLWNTGVGTTILREAVSLMGGYGITEDCPGFVGMKWMDAQLEATYEGPESVQRRQLTVTMTSPLFHAHLANWIEELKRLDEKRPGMGADGTAWLPAAAPLVAAMELWRSALEFLQKEKGAKGKPLYSGQYQGVTNAMTDALGWIMAAYAQIRDVVELAEKGPEHPVVGAEIDGLVRFFSDLAMISAGRSAGEVARITAELVYGYAAPGAPENADFAAKRGTLERALAGVRAARCRAAEAITKVMIPEALDYPQ